MSRSAVSIVEIHNQTGFGWRCVQVVDLQPDQSTLDDRQVQARPSEQVRRVSRGWTRFEAVAVAVP